MNKIMALIPCLMLDNNREINKRSLLANKEFEFDEIAIYDQCFQESDFLEGFSYIGHADKRMGWVEPRNKLLEYFYNSDFDYAFWIDANSTVSGPTQNDLATILTNIRNGTLNDCDAIFGTLGMWVSQDRIRIKSQPDFYDNVHVIPAATDKSYNWMHGLVMKNYKKYYNNEYYIDERCDTRKGTADDVFFSRMLRKLVSCYVAPTVVINKPSSKMSCTWANEKGTYDYPPTLYDVIDRYIIEDIIKNNFEPIAGSKLVEEKILPRVSYKKELIKPYVSRKKKEDFKEEHKVISLF